MRLPLLLLRRGDILGILVGAVFVIFVIYASIEFPGPLAKRMIQSDRLGPSWTCQYVASGEPVCVKDAPKPPAN